MSAGLHVGLILDGNGRWAGARGLSRSAGHRAGLAAVRRTVAAAPEHGIGALTLFAFSCDNWLRPVHEVVALMDVLAGYLEGELATHLARGVRVRAIGRRDRLPGRLRDAVELAERRTAGGATLELSIAIDYSSRHEVLRAARDLGDELAGADDERALAALTGRLAGGALARPVDLLVRTGGERRLSDFLLWESAYAELLFLDLPWPEFGPDELAGAVAEFHRRERRFGKVPPIDSGRLAAR